MAQQQQLIVQDWRGTEQETRDRLLADVWSRVTAGDWTSRSTFGEIEDDIYDLATRGALRDELPGVDTSTQQQYRNALAGLATTTVDYAPDGPWAFYSIRGRTNPYQNPKRRRVAVHIHPDPGAVVAAVQFIIQNVLANAYVSEFKVSRRLASAMQRLDTMEIYYQDGDITNNAQAIAAALGALGTRAEGHPAMLNELARGVGQGDEPGTRGVSFSEHRATQIAKVVYDHLDGTDPCTGTTFASKVKVKFTTYHIDYDHPSRNI